MPAYDVPTGWKKLCSVMMAVSGVKVIVMSPRARRTQGNIAE